MVFDPCEHQKTQMVLKAGAIIRQLKGLPEENNITTLYNETAPLLGILVKSMSSSTANHLPSPSETKDRSGKFILPRRDCPACGKENSLQLNPLCLSCSDAEGGKYKSMWFCGDMQPGTRDLIPDTGCGHKERLEESLLQYCVEHKIELPVGMKQYTGIQTMTDKGLK